MAILQCLPEFRRGNEGLARLGIEKSDAARSQATVGRDEGERPTAVPVQVRRDLLSESGRSLIGVFDGRRRDIFLRNCPI
jgi:hypothetical protein